MTETPPPVEYGDEEYPDRRVLRAVVWNIAQGRCEHPVPAALPGRLRSCDQTAIELAHIQPRGMGHTGYRDTVNNTMAACALHARTTDDLTAPAWQDVPAPGDRLALAAWVKAQRRAAGWAV